MATTAASTGASMQYRDATVPVASRYCMDAPVDAAVVAIVDVKEREN